MNSCPSRLVRPLAQRIFSGLALGASATVSINLSFTRESASDHTNMFCWLSVKKRSLSPTAPRSGGGTIRGLVRFGRRNVQRVLYWWSGCLLYTTSAGFREPSARVIRMGVFLPVQDTGDCVVAGSNFCYSRVCEVEQLCPGTRGFLCCAIDRQSQFFVALCLGNLGRCPSEDVFLKSKPRHFLHRYDQCFSFVWAKLAETSALCGFVQVRCRVVSLRSRNNT